MNDAGSSLIGNSEQDIVFGPANERELCKKIINYTQNKTGICTTYIK